MAEFYINKYVVQVEKGHPGSTSYKIIGTREGMAEMVRALGEALDKPEQELRHQWQADDSPTTLWQEYATIARGRTSRVYLSFATAKDLAPYHVRPSMVKEVLHTIGCLLVPVAIVLAVIGVITAVKWVF